ncbi:LysR substrate-binding domain-containing protein [Roseiterribacter gracilis]|uniref:LysR family transcriptional regulator n=1 Tax=Roseiterribacter gracilis TaxID=2812848 RepID=A0A8S8X5U0_9PROT|nr:LysR family transcriptional regulator [Rhodospirillales bacterium TMPK1]
MTLEQLRLFISVASLEHMTRGAAAAGRTQSATSAAIASLERHFGTKLFDRVGRRVALTDAGRLLLQEARVLIARADALQVSMQELAGLARGRVAIHASQTIAAYWLPAKLADFRNKHPDVEVAVAIGNTRQVAHSVRDGSADIGFVEGAIGLDHLDERSFDGDRLALLVGARHVLADKKKLDAATLANADWVLREPDSGTRTELEAALPSFGVDPSKLRVVLELPSNEAVRAAVEAGAGLTAISELVAEASLRAGTLKRLEPTLPARHFALVTHHERNLSAAAQAFVAVALPRL